MAKKQSKKGVEYETPEATQSKKPFVYVTPPEINSAVKSAAQRQKAKSDSADEAASNSAGEFEFVRIGRYAPFALSKAAEAEDEAFALSKAVETEAEAISKAQENNASIGYAMNQLKKIIALLEEGREQEANHRLRDVWIPPRYTIKQVLEIETNSAQVNQPFRTYDILDENGTLAFKAAWYIASFEELGGIRPENQTLWLLDAACPADLDWWGRLGLGETTFVLAHLRCTHYRIYCKCPLEYENVFNVLLGDTINYRTMPFNTVASYLTADWNALTSQEREVLEYRENQQRLRNKQGGKE